MRFSLNAWLRLCFASAFAMPLVGGRCGAQSEPPSQAESSPVQRGALVYRVVHPFLQNSCHSGLSIAAVQHGSVDFYDFGFTSRARRTKPKPDSVYEIASVTKTFTGALAAMALVEGRMQLDADFRKFLPGIYPNLAFEGHPITLRSLATHTSGLPRDLPGTDDLFARPNPETLPHQLIARDSGFDRARYLADLHRIALTDQPGMKENYSNIGFKVIGWGLETVYRTGFEQLMRQQLLRPLGMSSTGFVLDVDERSRLVSGYSPAGRRMPLHLRNAGAAYGLYSTPRDMAKYVQWQLKEMNPVIRLAHTPVAGDNRVGKALVWNLSTLDGLRELWHGGGTFGMSSQVVLFPDSDDGYVLLANDACKGTETALKEVAVAIHREMISSKTPARVPPRRSSRQRP